MYIDFTICSENCDFAELNKIFTNSHLILKGSKLKTGKEIPYNEFNLIFEQENIFYTDDLISSFRHFLGERFNYLYTYIQRFQLKSSICIVISDNEEQPALSISNENLIFLCKMNSDIDFDFI